MKILRMGKIPEPTKYIYTCANCNTKVECTEDEVTTSHGGLHKSVECPLCDKLIVKYFGRGMYD